MRQPWLKSVGIVVVFLIAGTAWATAGTFTAFGPQSYQRGTGAPVTVTTTFSVLNPNTQYTLRAFNGGLQDSQTELVSSGFVTVNGVQVIGPNNFGQQVSEVDVPVTLQSSNTLSVQLRGQPGGILTIEIIGVDNDLPTIQASVSPAPNSGGWNNTDVTVAFVCADATSAVTCPGPRTVTSEGANQVISGTATDAAGNTASASVTLSIDKTPPSLSITSPANGATLASSSIAVTGAVSDGLSGVAAVVCDGVPATVQNGTFSCPVTLTPGSNTITVQAIDVAGNFTSAVESVTLAITPVISTFNPHAAPAGGLAFTLNINGSNFLAGSIVEWNGSDRPTTFVSDTKLQAAIPASDLASAGTATVTVVTGGSSSNAVTFSIAPDTIVFSSNGALDGSNNANANNTYNVWVMNPDGSGAKPLTQLTAKGADVNGTVWSPDGSKIEFDSLRALDGSDAASFNSQNNSNDNIWVMNADGSGAQPLTRLTALGANSQGTAWSPDGSQILYHSGRALDGSDNATFNGIFNVWVMNADGSGSKPLTHLTRLFAFGGGSDNPIWSPDGSKIVYDSNGALDGSDNANPDVNVWIMNADGSGAKPLTHLTALQALSCCPAWSPDGSKIAFLSSGAFDGSDTNIFASNVWVMNADGSDAKPLTQLTTGGTSIVRWSPDGGKIAFGSFRALDGSDAPGTNFTDNIWVMNADGSGTKPLTQLTAAAASSAGPVWSPDGSQIIFTGLRAVDGSDNVNPNFNENIWVMNADGSNPKPLTQLTAPGANSILPSHP
jgi:Tol biopolymer transport system component